MTNEQIALMLLRAGVANLSPAARVAWKDQVSEFLATLANETPKAAA
jgi:hypothetical protein